MTWVHYLAWFMGGVFLVNMIPHLVLGVSGRPFQTPLATPRGIGLSSSTVNAIWGFINLAISYLLVVHVGNFDLRAIGDVASFGLGAFLIALFLAQHFGKLHGGNTPRQS
jgi:hypothetical protein